MEVKGTEAKILVAWWQWEGSGGDNVGVTAHSNVSFFNSAIVETEVNTQPILLGTLQRYGKFLFDWIYKGEGGKSFSWELGVARC